MALTRENAAKQICNDSWNCSFVVDLIGPGYKCDELAVGRGSKVKKLAREKAPFTTKDIIPDGEFSYLAVTDQADYAPQQVESGPGGKPTKRPPYPKNLGAWRTEPIIWIGYSAANDTEQPQPLNRTVDGWYDAYTPTIFGCEYYETNYSIEFRYIFPRDTHRYRRAAAYHSMGATLRSFLNGTIEKRYNLVSTDLEMTRLMDDFNYLPVKNLQNEIQNFYEEMILSLLSKPQFAVVAWAQHPSQPSGIRVGGAETNYPCIRTRLSVFYEYRLIQLCLVYGVSILLAVVGACSGLVAAREEGVMRDMKMSSIIAVTRAQDLNMVQSSDDLDSQSLKIAFGWVLKLHGWIRGFGLEEEVTRERPHLGPRSTSPQYVGERATF